MKPLLVAAVGLVRLGLGLAGRVPGLRYARFLSLGDRARFELGRGNLERASALARELLGMADLYRNDWNHGNAVHQAHLVLGRVALATGDRATACAELLEAGRTPGSPQLDSFGPSMALAQDLLRAGERQAVATYLRLCRELWKAGAADLDRWLANTSTGPISRAGNSQRVTNDRKDGGSRPGSFVSRTATHGLPSGEGRTRHATHPLASEAPSRRASGTSHSGSRRRGESSTRPTNASTILSMLGRVVMTVLTRVPSRLPQAPSACAVHGADPGVLPTNLVPADAGGRQDGKVGDTAVEKASPLGGEAERAQREVVRNTDQWVGACRLERAARRIALDDVNGRRQLAARRGSGVDAEGRVTEQVHGQRDRPRTRRGAALRSASPGLRSRRSRADIMPFP